MGRQSICIHAKDADRYVVSLPMDDCTLVASPKIDVDDICWSYYGWQGAGILQQLFPNLGDSLSAMEMMGIATRPYPHLGVTVKLMYSDRNFRNIAYGWSGNYQQGPAGVSGCEVSFALADLAGQPWGAIAARLALACLFANRLTLQHCYSIVPAKHKKARMFCAGVGMKPIGVMPKGFWWDGMPDDAALFSFTSGDLEKFFSFSLISGTIEDKGQVPENDERQKQFREESASPTG